MRLQPVNGFLPKPRTVKTLYAVVSFFLLLVCGQVKAQQDTFHVKSKLVVTVLPSRDILYTNEDNKIIVRYTGKYSVGKVQLLGGTVDKKTDSTYVLKVTGGTEAVLSVYEKMQNGTMRLALNKKYKIFSRPVPNVYLDGVKCDSVIDRFTLIASGRLHARSKYTGDKYIIKSFNLVIPGQKLDTLSAIGNQLTQDMKIAIDGLEKGKGGMLIFRDIKCEMPTGEEKTLPVFRVYIIDGPKTKVGL
ncbi:MAG: hypothetical protein FD123_1142 [Bacteroidetes bacterium]|nr:MAG: hypothetical protein FD123_1142 [Bacteroidota bacterium]